MGTARFPSQARAAPARTAGLRRHDDDRRRGLLSLRSGGATALPKQTDAEYRTEVLYAVLGYLLPMVGTDIRNMTAIMTQLLLEPTSAEDQPGRGEDRREDLHVRRHRRLGPPPHRRERDRAFPNLGDDAATRRNAPPTSASAPPARGDRRAQIAHAERGRRLLAARRVARHGAFMNMKNRGGERSVRITFRRRARRSHALNLARRAIVEQSRGRRAQARFAASNSASSRSSSCAGFPGAWAAPMSVPSANLTLPILSAWREREELLAQITSLVTLAAACAIRALHKLGAGYKPRVIEQKMPDRRALEGELGLGTCGPPPPAFSIARCASPRFRVATGLRVVEAVRAGSARCQRTGAGGRRNRRAGGTRAPSPCAADAPFTLGFTSACSLGWRAPERLRRQGLATDPGSEGCATTGRCSGRSRPHPASELRAHGGGRRGARVCAGLFPLGRAPTPHARPRRAFRRHHRAR